MALIVLKKIREQNSWLTYAIIDIIFPSNVIIFSYKYAFLSSYNSYLTRYVHTHLTLTTDPGGRQDRSH